MCVLNKMGRGLNRKEVVYVQRRGTCTLSRNWESKVRLWGYVLIL